MRLPLALSVVLLIASCGQRTPSLDSEFREVRKLLASERYEQAHARAQAALTRAEQSHATADVWRLRVIALDAMLGQRRLEDAERALRTYGALSAGPASPEVPGRLLLARGRLLYARGDDVGASQAFSEATE